jgi:hypothetical protein
MHDRQWLVMLHMAFEGTSYEDMVNAGMSENFATEVLGLVALNYRQAG